MGCDTESLTPKPHRSAVVSTGVGDKVQTAEETEAEGKAFQGDMHLVEGIEKALGI